MVLVNLIIGIIANVLLFILALSLIMPRKVFSYSGRKIFDLIYKYRFCIVGLIVVEMLQNLEVRLVDPIATEWINMKLGVDYFTDLFYSIEGDLVPTLALWTHQSNFFSWGLMYFFIVIYTQLYPFILWFMPLYFVAEDDRASRLGIHTFLVTYAIQFAFMLFLPVTNVFTYMDLDLAIEYLIPNYIDSYYLNTTPNNCFPSLHVAMPFAAMLASLYSPNKKVKWLTIPSAILIASSTIYLAIHWILDVLAGITLATGAFLIAKKLLKREEREKDAG